MYHVLCKVVLFKTLKILIHLLLHSYSMNKCSFAFVIFTKELDWQGHLEHV